MRIFCLGSNKTGTTSLERALIQLGFRLIPYDKSYGLYFGGGLKHSRENILRLFNIFEQRKYDYDLYSDIPYNLAGSHEILYELFPESYFILTIRNPESWFYSVLNWIQKRKCQTMYNLIWKIEFITSNKIEIINRYNNRNNEIIQFFNNNSKFLVINIEEKTNYSKLCQFLDKEIIDKPFPHENKS